ncbi:phosphate transporter PHO1 homolog 10-like [Malania oleifera]|uniref:phosphate transporter PHO1 homolog 10-like n=1 Tax=Malania oleifera TaxID=397392 RepID=UPI0025AE48AE|nr:phosphate transporter PHO1 homolog 10-like [Malania oleifera]
MKFGKAFKKQMVPEWTEAYMDYNGLKRVLREIRRSKQNKQPAMASGASQQRLYRAFSGLNLQPGERQNEEDVEDQVISVNTMQKEGSRKFYKTKFLMQSEEGGENEVRFFRKLDQELNKVNTFYKDKVEEVMNEAVSLNKQMEAFIALRIKVENPDVDGSSFKKCHSTGISSVPPLRITSPSRPSTSGIEHVDVRFGVEMSDECQLEDAIDNRRSGAKEQKDPSIQVDMSSNHRPEVSNDRGENFVHTSSCRSVCIEEVHSNDDQTAHFEILERVKINNTLETPMSTIKGVFKDSKEEELSYKKEELRTVEERLKLVFIEFYQKLRLLKHYSFMNLSAFSKIMKKYEKITSRSASRSYMQTVDDSYLGSSDEVIGLLERVETTFVKHFSNLNRREGMKSLRPKTKREKHRITFFSGFFSGCSVALLVAIILIIEARNVMDKEGPSYMENIFPLYSLFAYIALHMLMYATNIYFWRRYRVNYPFIFGFKQGTELGYREVFLLSTGLAVLALASFLTNLHMDLDSRARHYRILTELVPLGLVSIVLVITFCPFNIIYRSSRFFLIQCIFRCICAPLYQVTLPDFFLADQLTSQVQAIRCLEFYICYYCSGEFSRRQNKCHSRDAYNVFYFIVAVIPYWIRCLQCLRRLFEDKDAMHGYNGLKYFLTVVAVVIRTAFELKKGMTWKVLALISSAIAAIMSTYWDIMVDWGLLQRKSKNFCLRDKLLVSHKSVYFAAMVLNILLRFAWLQLVLKFNVRSLHGKALSIIVACLEILRRGIWNFFRLENEHLNNVGKYRAFKSVPLPFSYCDDDDSEKND